MRAFVICCTARARTGEKRVIMTEITTKGFDVIIIGGGPAGVSVALYAARGGLSVAILHNSASALHRTERIENYYGTGAVSGAELYDRGIEQARALGVSVIDCQATFAQTDGATFTVSTTIGEMHAKRLVVATGAARKTVDIAGLKEYEGKGVSYCAVCDAFFYRKKRVGVIGAGEFAEHEYSALKNVVGTAYLLTNGETPSFAADNVVSGKIARVSGRDGRVCGVTFEDGTELELDGLFVAIGVMGSGSLAKSIGAFTDGNGAIVTDERGETNVAGLYAAGDCTAGVKQVGRAVADGMTVGLALINDLKRGG